MPSSHLILCHPLLLLPPIFLSIRVFSNGSVLRIRWPKYRSFSFNISPSSENLGLTSFRMDWLGLLFGGFCVHLCLASCMEVLQDLGRQVVVRGSTHLSPDHCLLASQKQKVEWWFQGDKEDFLWWFSGYRVFSFQRWRNPRDLWYTVWMYLTLLNCTLKEQLRR